MNQKQDLYKVPIISSWGAVTLVNHEGLIDPMHRVAAIALDEKNLPMRPEELDRDPMRMKSLVVVTRRTGDPRPSDLEISFCAAWKKALDGSGVVLADYIVMSGGSHYSFATEKVEGPGPKGF